MIPPALSSLCDVGERFRNALTLVNVGTREQPLIYVNLAFCELTGYEAQEILGRNCRFLQGPNTAKDDATRIRDAIHGNRAIFCDLLNYRKDGQKFYNRLVLLPLQIDTGTYFIGMQIDSTDLVSDRLSKDKEFNDVKTSEGIRDRINTPLMKILTALTLADGSPMQERILIRSFEQIVDTVRNLPFND